jgi:arylsulfatase A-like enzyme
VLFSRQPLAAAALVSILGATAAIGAADAPRPNIVFILTDDQGYGEMSCHGNPILQTPNLDRLHAEGVRFTDFHVSPTCAPTRAALQTGRHEFRSGVTHTIAERERLSLKATTLAGVLRGAGYATGIFGKWHQGDEEAYRPYRRGFDETFIHGAGGIGQTYPGSCGDAPGNTYFDPAVLHNGVFEKTKGFCTDVFFGKAIGWIREKKAEGKRFFAWITPNAAHSPYVCPEEYRKRFVGKGLKDDAIAYYGMIAGIDDNVGKLLEELRRLGIERETLVIFMTDNGHSIGNLYNAGMRGMKGTPYQGGTRVPAFFRWPGTLEPRDVGDLAAHVDIFPTLAEIAGAKLPDVPLDGRSLVPLLRDPKASWPDRTLFIHLGRWQKGKARESKHASCAVRTTRFRLVNDRELYDIPADPGETTDVSDRNPEAVAAIRKAYDAWWESVLPCLENEDAVGPKENPFKELYRKQYGLPPPAGSGEAAPKGEAAAPAPHAGSRPNFLFIFTDDQRWDAMGVVGREMGDRARFPWLRTPNMDRLAAEGIRFRNAFAVCALCSPSRAAFLTGRYNHANGIANNRTPFPEGAVTHATLLRAAGYRTGYVGKWHMDNQRGPRPGFDESASFIGHARYRDAPFEIDGRPMETKGWVDDASTDFAIEFLKRNRERPFLLVVGYKTPHGPFQPPDRLKDLFAGEEARPPANAGSVPPFRANRPAGRAGAPARTNLDYFRCIAGVDENLGRLLETLDGLGLARGTLVVYASDNGFYLGEHGLGDKRSAYDESMRIPFIARHPALASGGRTADEMVLNIDLAPTLLDLAGLPVPAEMQGRSLRPLLEGKASGWRTSFFYEYFFERNFNTPTVTAVRTTEAKLVKYPGKEEWTELFDLRADPYETRNLAGDPAHNGLRERLEEAYVRLAEGVRFRIPPYADRPEEPRPRESRPVLRYDFAAEGGEGAARIADGSGAGNGGQAHDVPSAAGRDGKRARKFDGRGWIDVPKAPSLDPSGGPWTVEAVVRADGPDGIVLARGGQSRGYAVFLEEGRPAFAVRAGGSLAVARSKTSVAGRWARIGGIISADRRVLLRVDGKLEAEAPLPAFIPSDPSDGMEIGADRGSPVLGTGKSKGFTGLIESVRISSGEVPAENR